MDIFAFILVIVFAVGLVGAGCATVYFAVELLKEEEYGYFFIFTWFGLIIFAVTAFIVSLAVTKL